MNTKQVSHVATYMGFIFTFGILSQLLPTLITPFLIISWCIQAIYYKLLGKSIWIKTQIGQEMLKVREYYDIVLNSYVLFKQAFEISVSTQIYKLQIESLPHPMAERLMYLIDARSSALITLVPFLLPVLCIAVKLTAIYLCYKLLLSQGFFRRLII